MQKQDELGVRFEKYQVFAKLAVGGMAELFLAKQPGIGGFRKTVVLKCILPHLAQEEEFVTMFLDEARVVAPLDHPNIVQIYEIGEAGGVYYIAMEYIRGQTLKEFRKKLYQQNPEVKPYKLAAGVIAQAASGLHQAHIARDDEGVPLQLVHRDVSPTNLIVSYNGVVKLVDFGVAKASNQQHRTSAGTIKGKYRYMSPEQIRGQELDARSDVFSLGIVLYELSTNAALFGRRHEAEIIDAVRNARVPAPSKFRQDYPEALEKIVLKALEQDREARYQSADELRLALEKYMRDEGAFYGTTQLAELMQFLFSKEQGEERTGITNKPLSPADFVRFLGDFPDSNAMAALTGSYSRNNPSSGSYSDPNSRPAGSSWSTGSGQASHTPQPGGPGTANYGPRQQTPAIPTVSPFAGEPPPEIPHADAAFLPEETRTELSPHGDSLDPFALDVDITPIQSIPIEDPDLPTNDDQAPARRKRRWMFVLLFVLLASGGIGTYFGLRQTTPLVDFGTEQVQVESHLAGQRYLNARNQLRQLARRSLTPTQKQWVLRAQQRALVGPQIDMAQQMYDQKEYEACLKILAQLQTKAPHAPRLTILMGEAQKALQAAQAAQARQVEPRQPERREPVQPPDPPRARPDKRRRRRRRWRPRPRPRARKRRVAMAIRRVAPPRPARLTLRSRPSSDVILNGKSIGRTPIRNKSMPAGTYRITFVRDEYATITRTINVDEGQSKDLEVSLRPIPRARPRIEPRIEPRVEPRVRPTPSGPQAKLPFSAVRLARRTRLRIYISDPRGLGGRHATLQLRKLARQIERETGRLLGSGFRVSGVTRAWQRVVRERATQQNQDYYTFYPRAVAHTIYHGLLRGRSAKRIAQILIKYEYRNRFKRIRD